MQLNDSADRAGRRIEISGVPSDSVAEADRIIVRIEFDVRSRTIAVSVEKTRNGSEFNAP